MSITVILLLLLGASNIANATKRLKLESINESDLPKNRGPEPLEHQITICPKNRVVRGVSGETVKAYQAPDGTIHHNVNDRKYNIQCGGVYWSQGGYINEWKSFYRSDWSNFGDKFDVGGKFLWNYILIGFESKPDMEDNKNRIAKGQTRDRKFRFYFAESRNVHYLRGNDRKRMEEHTYLPKGMQYFYENFGRNSYQCNEIFSKRNDQRLFYFKLGKTDKMSSW